MTSSNKSLQDTASTTCSIQVTVTSTVYVEEVRLYLGTFTSSISLVTFSYIRLKIVLSVVIMETKIHILAIVFVLVPIHDFYLSMKSLCCPRNNYKGKRICKLKEMTFSILIREFCVQFYS